jgi:hypothetical protein
MAAGVMAIHYRSDNIPQAARSVANEFSDAWNRLNTINNRVLSIRENSGRNYLSNASYFIKLKRAQYEKKNEQALRFATRVDSFLGECKNTDARVATHIEQSYKFFKRVTGIGKSAVAAFFDKLWDSAKDFIAKALFVVITLPLRIALAPFFAIIKIADVVVKFYNSLPEELRYAIKAGLAIVKCALAVVALFTITATGIAAVLIAVGALILLADAFVGVLRSSAVLAYSWSGDSDMARKLDGMSNGELFGTAMEVWGLGDARSWAAFYDGMVIVGSVLYIGGKGIDFFKNVGDAVKGVGGKIPMKWGDAFKKELVKELFPYKEGMTNISRFGKNYIAQSSWKVRLGLNVDKAVEGFKDLLGFTETFVFNNILLFHDFASGKFNAGDIISQFMDMFVPEGDKVNKIFKLAGEAYEMM